MKLLLYGIENSLLWIVDCGLDVLRNFFHELFTPEWVIFIIVDDAYMPDIKWYVAFS